MSSGARKRIRYYNLGDYATGDGVTDDTDAINAWFSDVVADQAEAVIPRGTFVTAKRTSGARQLGPAVKVDGLRIVGQGVGESIIKSTVADYGYILSNAGNDMDWVVEGLEIQGPGAGSIATGITVDASGLYGATFGPGVVGFKGYSFILGEFRSCQVHGCNVGIVDESGQNNLWAESVRVYDNKNAGIAILDGLGSVFRGIAQVQNPSGNAATTEVVANVLLAKSVPQGTGPKAAWVASRFVDELGFNAAGGGSCVHVAAGEDVLVTSGRMYAPGKQQPAGSPYYGLRIGSASVRTKVSGTRILPYVVDANRVPTNTILIEAGATDTVLTDCSTDPNTANGGGDISNAGTRTVYRNVVPNGGIPLNT